MPSITLHFKSELQKQSFLGQFSDGWGENFVQYNQTGDDLHVRFVSDPAFEGTYEEAKANGITVDE